MKRSPVPMKIVVRPVQPILTRRFRATLHDDGTSLASQGFSPHFGLPLELPHGLKVFKNSEPQTFTAHGACIYCGETQWAPNSSQRLSGEHIIPEGIGGSFILPEASCKKCADKTSSIEGDVQRQLLLALKRSMGIKGKKKPKSDLVPLVIATNTADKVAQIPFWNHPAYIFFILMHSPRLLSLRSAGSPGVAGVMLDAIGPTNSLRELDIKAVHTPPFDTLRFCQLIAKIAHGYAITFAQRLNFTPLLPDFIRRRFGRNEIYNECYDLVGGCPEVFAPSAALHEMWLEKLRLGHGTFVVVYVRLFACLRGPVYCAVAGKIEGR